MVQHYDIFQHHGAGGAAPITKGMLDFSRISKGVSEFNLDIETDNYTFLSPLKKCGIMRDLGAKASDSLLVMWAKLRREINF